MSLKKLFLLAICALLLAAFAVNVAAIPPLPLVAERIDLGDGLAFYLIPPDTAPAGFPASSGLFRDGELVYSFDDWTLHIGQHSDLLFFSADAMSLLAVPWLAGGSVRFFEQGVLSHSSNIMWHLRGAVGLEAVPFSGERLWQIPEKTYHDRANDLLRITTLQGYEIIFDLTTGYILSNDRVFDPIVETVETTTPLPAPIEEPRRNSNIFHDIGAVFVIIGNLIFCFLGLRLWRSGVKPDAIQKAYDTKNAKLFFTPQQWAEVYGGVLRRVGLLSAVTSAAIIAILIGSRILFTSQTVRDIIFFALCLAMIIEGFLLVRISKKKSGLNMLSAFPFDIGDKEAFERHNNKQQEGK
jgi:hypothetical protein